MPKYISYKDPLPFLLVKDYFSEKDMNLMMQELQFLTSETKLSYSPPTNMPDGTKQNTQISLDRIYNERGISDILGRLDTIYQDEQLINKLIERADGIIEKYIKGDQRKLYDFASHNIFNDAEAVYGTGLVKKIQEVSQDLTSPQVFALSRQVSTMSGVNAALENSYAEIFKNNSNRKMVWK